MERGAGGVEDVDEVTNAVLTASRLLVAVSARSLAAVEHRVTLPQFRVLVLLQQRGGGKVVALAEQLGVNPSTATRMVDRLIASGFVDRRPNPDNRRENRLRLTDAGLHIVAEVTAHRRAEIDRIVARMGAEQRTALVAALTAFTEAGGEPSAASAGSQGRDLYPLGWTDSVPGQDVSTTFHR